LAGGGALAGACRAAPPENSAMAALHGTRTGAVLEFENRNSGTSARRRGAPHRNWRLVNSLVAAGGCLYIFDMGPG